MDKQLGNICRLAHKIAALRRKLKEYDGESSYIKKKVDEFNNQAQIILENYLLLSEKSHSWVNDVEILLLIMNPNGFLDASKITLLENMAVDLFYLIKSQYNLFDLNARKHKHIEGVVVNPRFPLLVKEKGEEFELDQSDLDYVIVLSHGGETAEYRLISSNMGNVSEYDVSRKICKQLGVKYPATCYASYH